MNQNSWWTVLLVVAVVTISAIYSLPNLYPDEPAIQVSGGSASMQISDDVAHRAEEALKAANLPYKPFERLENSILIRIGDSEAQVKAKEIVQAALGDGVVIAFNLAPTTPAWMLALGADPMKLGLDLRGGVHFMLEVDMEKAVARREEGWLEQIRTSLREKLSDGQRYKSVRRGAEGIEVRFESAEVRDRAAGIIKGMTNDFFVSEVDAANEFILLLKMTPAALKAIADEAIDQNRTTISNRVNELGVAEPLVQRQGMNRIVVELPGVQDTATAKRVLGRTASLEFRLVELEGGGEVFPFKDNREPPVTLKREKIVTGDSVTSAQQGFDQQSNQPNVSITLDTKGGRAMQRATVDNVGKPMAVLFVETKSAARTVTNPDGSKSVVIDKKEEKYVINQATIRDVLGVQFQITGLDSPAEAAELALLLRSGALAAPMYFVEERTIGPSLGKENIQAGLQAAVYGFLLVVVFMVVNYRLSGVFACIALVGNLLLLLALLGAINTTLTMPGIAGIVLTMGIAVDANVLINERIREELRKGLPVQQAMDRGYSRAWATIFDSHITTMIVGIILFAFGAGSVKGFAITLTLGIATSLYTAIVFSRVLMNWKYGGKPVQSLSIQPLWVRA
ncbi:MAG: protein translocase subunit SecD [Gammaproteobacteria bacterium]